MHVRKRVLENVLRLLTDRQASIRSKLNHNKYKMKALVEEQTVLKRELAELHNLVRSVSKKG